jgi:hypothetical protein
MMSKFSSFPSQSILEEDVDPGLSFKDCNIQGVIHQIHQGKLMNRSNQHT